MWWKQIRFSINTKKVSKVNNIDILDVSHMSRKLIKQGTEEILIEYFYTEISLKDVDKWEAIKFW